MKWTFPYRTPKTPRSECANYSLMGLLWTLPTPQSIMAVGFLTKFCLVHLPNVNHEDRCSKFHNQSWDAKVVRSRGKDSLCLSMVTWVLPIMLIGTYVLRMSFNLIKICVIWVSIHHYKQAINHSNTCVQFNMMSKLVLLTLWCLVWHGFNTCVDAIQGQVIWSMLKWLQTTRCHNLYNFCFGRSKEDSWCRNPVW